MFVLTAATVSGWVKKLTVAPCLNTYLKLLQQGVSSSKNSLSAGLFSHVRGSPWSVWQCGHCVAATGRLQLSSIRGPGEQSPWGGSHAASKARGPEAGEARLFLDGCSKPTFQTTLNLARKDESRLAHSFCLHSTSFL